MKGLAPFVFRAVFDEMLGPWLWVIIAGAIIAALAFLWVKVREGRIASRRLIWSELAGPVGGIAALATVLAVTNSRLADLGGSIERLLAVGTFVAGFVGVTLCVYAMLGVLGIARVSTETSAEAAAVARPNRPQRLRF